MVDVVGGGIVVDVGLVVDSVSNRNIVIISHVVYLFPYCSYTLWGKEHDTCVNKYKYAYALYVLDSLMHETNRNINVKIF